jgi:hypothetical protein
MRDIERILRSRRIARPADTIATQSLTAFGDTSRIVLTRGSSATDVFCRAPELRIQLRQAAIITTSIPLARSSEPAQHWTIGAGRM